MPEVRIRRGLGMRWGWRLKAAATYTILSVVGISMVAPFLWMISTSLKEEGEVFQFPPRWLPWKAQVKLADGTWVETLSARRRPGRFIVEKLSGPEAGEKVELTGERLKRSWGRYYIYEAVAAPSTGRDGRLTARRPVKACRRVWVRIVEVVEPERWRVRYRIEEGGRKRVKSLVVGVERLRWKLAPRWSNFREAWRQVQLGRAYFNSVLVAVCVTLGQVLTSALAAFAFSRLRFPGRDKLFLGYLATMMIPGAVIMIPNFILMKKLGLVDTYFCLIVPCMFTAYGTFMLRQFFMTLPVELEEAAQIDGCSLLGIFWRITLPLSKPALATLAIFTFMGNWRSFTWPLIMISDPAKRTIPLALVSFQGLYSTQWTLLMAGTLLSLIPVIIIFILGQRYFVEGIRLGAVKG